MIATWSIHSSSIDGHFGWTIKINHASTSHLFFILAVQTIVTINIVPNIIGCTMYEPTPHFMSPFLFFSPQNDTWQKQLNHLLNTWKWKSNIIRASCLALHALYAVLTMQKVMQHVDIFGIYWLTLAISYCVWYSGCYNCGAWLECLILLCQIIYP